MKHEKMAKKVLAVILSASLTMGPAELAGAVDISDEISASEETFSEGPEVYAEANMNEENASAPDEVFTDGEEESGDQNTDSGEEFSAGFDDDDGDYSLDYGISGDLKWSIDYSGCLYFEGNGDYDPEDMSWLNSDSKEYVKTVIFNVTGITNMSGMLAYLENLEEVSCMDHCDFSHVTDMSDLFGKCEALKKVDLSAFDTSNVTNMSDMFSYCRSLETVDVSGFNTSKVTDMSGMFSYCESLNMIDVSNFDTTQVTNFNSMFSNCEKLTALDVSGFDTAKATDMSGMFGHCDSLETADVSRFNTSKVTDMSGMFAACVSLKTIDVSRFNTSKVTDMSWMFNACVSLISLDVSNFDTLNVTNMSNMFWGCSSLETVDVSRFNTSKVTDMSTLFADCTSLISLDISNFDTSKVIDMSYMFGNCKSFTSLNLNNFNTSSVINMKGMFYWCESLKELDLSKFDVSNVTEDMSFMFTNCDSILVLKTMPNLQLTVEVPELAKHRIGEDGINYRQVVTRYMYDSAGNQYDTFPTGVGSMTLSRTEEGEAPTAPKPTSTPTPKPTVTAAPDPTATPTPRPTATVVPTATPKPTVTVTPTATPTPTPDPTATPTITPTPADKTVITKDTYKDFEGTEIRISQEVKKIEDGAFADCKNLESIYFYGDCPKMGSGAFSGLQASATIYYPVGNTTWTNKIRSQYNWVYWKGWDTATGEIYGQCLEDGSLTLKTTEIIYNGKSQKPGYALKYDGREIDNAKAGTYYNITYKNNKSVGTATVTVEGIHPYYYGTLTKTFKILKKGSLLTNTITTKVKSTVTKTQKSSKQTFSLGTKVKGKAKLSYTSTDKNVKISSKGTVTIASDFIGTATITIKSAKTKTYKAASKKIVLTVKPSKPYFTSWENVKTRKISLKWKKNSKVTGYQIQYDTDDTFPKPVTKTITKATTTSYKTPALKKYEGYWVRIRAYKTVNGKKLYSSWSESELVSIIE